MSDEKKCPYCAETIKSEAIKCRYCGSQLLGTSSFANPLPVAPRIASCSRCDTALIAQETNKFISIAGLIGATFFLVGAAIAYLNLLFGVIIIVIGVLISLSGRGKNLQMVCPQCGNRSQSL